MLCGPRLLLRGPGEGPVNWKLIQSLLEGASALDAILGEQSRQAKIPQMQTPFERVLVKDVEVLDIRTDPPEEIDPEDP